MAASAKDRRAPWLSGMVVAVLGAVWMIGQVVGGVVALVGHVVSDAVPPVGVASTSGGAHW